MSLKDDIDVPLCVVIGLMVSIIVAVAAIGTEAGYNYVDRRKVYQRYEMMERERPDLNFSHPIKTKQFENLNQGSMPIDKAIRAVAANKGAAPAK